MITLGKFEVFFLIVFILIVVDTVIGNILPDFSMVDILASLAYLLGAFLAWIGLFFERLVYLDITTPVMFFIRLLFALGGLVGASVGNFFFDILKLFFDSIKSGLELIGWPTPWELNTPIGIYASIDFATFTVKIGLILDVLGNAVVGEMQISIFGTPAYIPANTRFEFSELGVFGIQARMSVIMLGSRLYPIGVLLSVEDTISSAFEAFFSVNGSLESLYYEIIDQFK